jgi:UDP-N-acetylglucosamine/UDP-N-acetylgalactosamine diphosphorylase
MELNWKNSFLMYFHFQSTKKRNLYSIEICESINRTFAVWEVCREDEFSPLKNGAGSKDTPETCRRDLILQHIRYLKQAGGLLQYVFYLENLININLNFSSRETDGNICEISPLVSYSGEVKNSYQSKTSL